MENIINRIKTLSFLKIVFLVSLIVSICGFIMLFLTSILSSTGVLHDNPGSAAIVVIDCIIAAARMLVFVGMAVAFIIAIKINKGCRNAFIVACVAAAIKIVVFILNLTTTVMYVRQILTLCSDVLVAISIFMLIDGIFEHKARKLPTFTLISLGLIFYVVGSVFTCLSTVAKFGGNLNLAFIFTGDILDVVSVCLIYTSFSKFFNVLKAPKESIDELKEAYIDETL